MNIVVALKLFNVFVLASVKYLLSFPYALMIGLNYEQAIVAIAVGGITGFFFFYHLSSYIIRFYKKFKLKVCEIVPGYFRYKFRMLCEKKQKNIPRNIFTRKNRWLVNLKTNYGFIGIIIASPILLSIPLGAFLLNKYYSRRKNIFAYMTVSILGWAVLFSVFAVIFPDLA